MSVDVTTSIVIDRPRPEVFAFAADLDRTGSWYRNITSVRWLTPKPLALGSRVVFTAKFLGRRLTYTYEVGELDPGERLVMRTQEGPFPMETTYTWEEEGEGATRMNVTGPVMVRAMRRANRRDLRQLKRLIESDAS